VALAPGSTIGILGGGQLARMLALAAARIGLKCHIFAPELDSPAFQVSAERTVAGYADEVALKTFAATVDVVTYEFENVPGACVSFLEPLVPVRPNSRALATTQNRIHEKTLANSLGVRTAAFAPVNSLTELRSAVTKIGMPAVLKTNSMGYDGKGQAKLLTVDQIEPAWLVMRDAPSIIEKFVDFACEVSVVAARGLNGTFAAYDVAENIHRDHILHQSIVPARIAEDLKIKAVDVSRRIMEELDYVGVMGVEFFVGHDGLYVNEMAPRVHNSGHWTQDACVVSQFEQHVRAVAGWPLGDPARHSDVVMTNLLGDDIRQWCELAGQSRVGLHIYGKAEARNGRKMGHFNSITPINKG
jgi:5-(carboxyamino)imidazole ribonucleotide synthase